MTYGISELGKFKGFRSDAVGGQELSKLCSFYCNQYIGISTYISFNLLSQIVYYKLAAVFSYYLNKCLAETISKIVEMDEIAIGQDRRKNAGCVPEISVVVLCFFC